MISINLNIRESQEKLNENNIFQNKTKKNKLFQYSYQHATLQDKHLSQQQQPKTKT